MTDQTITDAELKELEELLSTTAQHTVVAGYTFRTAIPKLIAEIRRLRDET